MSSIVNKIKEVVHSDKHSQPEGTSGPHNSRAANAADPRVDSDRDGSNTVGRTAGHGEYGSSGIGSTGHTTGHTTGTGIGHSSGTAEGAHGPHNSRVANTLDPRVDSDRDGSRTTGTTGFGTTGRTAGHGEFGSSGLGTSGTTEGAHGPHSSRVANTLDPRVDSDRDGSKTVGNAATTGYGSSSGFGTGHNTAEGTHGPHSSRAANTLDPRVDSDRDGSRTAGSSATTGFGSSGLGHSTGTTGFGTTGRTAGHGEFGSSGLGTSGTTEGAHGPHNSRMGNTLDPRVDSDRDGSKTVGGNAGHHLTSGPGPAPKTAGPHSSDVANKLDPRVDSDRDGSKTLGADRTYQ